MTRHQHDRVLAALLAANAGLARRVVDLEATAVMLRGSLSTAWTRIERLERQRGAPPRPSLPSRVSASRAAEALGVHVRSVRRLIDAGRLRGAAIPLPSGRRRRWVVETADLERLLAAQGGTRAATTVDLSGAPRAREGGSAT